MKEKNQKRKTAGTEIAFRLFVSAGGTDERLWRDGRAIEKCDL